MEANSAKLKDMAIADNAALNLFPKTNVMDTYRIAIIDEVHRITGVDKAIIRPAVAWTQTLEHGDLVLAVPALRLKGQPPAEVAEKIVDGFTSALLEPPSAEGGFIRFFCKIQPLATSVLSTICHQRERYGFNSALGLEDASDPSSRQKSIVIEFGSPNIAKEFHAGHLRSTIIGGFLVKLYQRLGWKTVAMNYLGDWGKQYGVLSQGFEKYGSEAELERDPIKHLHDVYVRINQDLSREQKPVVDAKKWIDEQQKLKTPAKPKKPAKGETAPPPKPVEWTEAQEQALQKAKLDLASKQKALEDLPSIDEKARRFFKRMTEGDPDAIRNWQRFRDLSIDRYQDMFARLNIEFDDYSGESTVKEANMAHIGELLAQKGISEESEGAVKIDFVKQGAKKLGVALVRKRDGTALYLTRDIAANYERYERYHFDKMLYVIASQQDTHTAQFFETLRLLGSPYKEVVERCEHIKFGLVKAASGETMSTRKGTVVSLADALDDIGEYMHELMQRTPEKYDKVHDKKWTADILGISSIIVYDFTGKRINGYNFDKKAMTSPEGDTGPYLQYAHARLCSVKREAIAKFGPMDEAITKADFTLTTATKEGANLVRLLSQWPDVVLNTLKTHEPVTVLTYLFKLAHRVSSCYEAKDDAKQRTMSVMYAATPEERAAVMALYDCARQVLRNGMEVLGLTPVEAM